MLPSPTNVDRKPARDRSLAYHIEVSAAAARVHRSGVSRLVVTKNPHQIDFDRFVPHRIRQDGLPTRHALVHRSAQSISILGEDGIVTILARLARAGESIRVKMLLAQRIVTRRTRRDRHHVDHLFEPRAIIRIVVRFDMDGETARLHGRSRSRGGSRPDRSGRSYPGNRTVRLTTVLLGVQLLDQFHADHRREACHPTDPSPLCECRWPCRPVP